MGHVVNRDREYKLLQQRLDYTLTGAPYSPVFIEILKLLFSPQEAEIARQIPVRPTPIDALAKRMNMDKEELHTYVVAMAERGLVFDFEYKNSCYVVLAPVVIGFFEFVYMRTRDNLPQAELAHLFEQYMFQDDRFAHSIFQGNTQLGRTLVYEESLPSGDYSEILDWEKASYVVETAKHIGVSLCACRHEAMHLGKNCDAPLKTCLTFDHSAELLIKRGMAEKIHTDQALSILHECKDAGLVQIADNVQQNVGFMCNCCGCCCGMLKAIKTFNIRNAVVTSNWLAEIKSEKCIGCGACAKACPLGAITLQSDETGRRWAVREESLCLGCGVCSSACKLGHIQMQPRKQKVLVPETTFDKMVLMAIERGKLATFLFDDPSRLSHRALGRIALAIEQAAPVKALMAVKPLRSAFLTTLAKGAKHFWG